MIPFIVRGWDLQPVFPRRALEAHLPNRVNIHLYGQGELHWSRILVEPVQPSNINLSNILTAKVLSSLQNSITYPVETSNPSCHGAMRYSSILMYFVVIYLVLTPIICVFDMLHSRLRRWRQAVSVLRMSATCKNLAGFLQKKSLTCQEKAAADAALNISEAYACWLLFTSWVFWLHQWFTQGSMKCSLTSFYISPIGT